MRRLASILLASFLFFRTSHLYAQLHEKTLTIIHTNDLQSRLLPFGPNRDYTPEIVGDDHTIGGIARMATLIRSLKQESPETTVLIDGGDFLMGTLFHTLAREEAPELRILHALGYDAITLGNHEFDFRPEGLAQILRTAKRHNALPPMLLANVAFSSSDARDDGLEKLFKEGVVKPYRIVVKNGLKIGVFGLIGKDAAEVSPFAAPLHFTDPIATAKRVAKTLKSAEKVDVLICASHGGVWRNEGSAEWAGEDVALAAAVPEIDVIVGGHSHTPLPKPIRAGRTYILQAGSEGGYVGKLDLKITAQGVVAENYRLHAVNDSIAADAEIEAEVQRYVESINQNVLAAHGYAFDQIIAETDFDLTIREDNSNLGNLVSDAIQWSLARYQPNLTKTPVIAMESNGLLRDNLQRGVSGLLQVSDIFRVAPLGIGVADDSAGYPLVSFYLSAAEIKKALEVLTSVYPWKGSSYYLQPAGLRFYFNPNRVLFDRVYEIELATAAAFTPLALASEEQRLYQVGCNIYNATFIKLIGDFTYGFLRIVPKDSLGQPLADFKDALLDARPDLAGVQEVKEWQALLDYVRTFPDSDGDGIPNLPERYRQPQARIISTASLNPTLLYKNATRVMWSATGGGLVMLLLVFSTGVYIFKHNKKKPRV
ncbi:bifunctional metallophosphatase/5'-nucleotidase [candidate division KSB1 bacterium]|nr:bifunctional metallophosphatase/5'-nucleotidase [candidate division KSB1 bacterium]